MFTKDWNTNIYLCSVEDIENFLDEIGTFLFLTQNLDVAQFSEIEISLFLQTFNGQLGFQELRILVPMLKDFLRVFLINNIITHPDWMRNA
jgi:hypothetical protein